MKVVMTQDKVTKNSIRFAEPKREDGDPHTKNIYLTKDEVHELGDPTSINVTIEPA